VGCVVGVLALAALGCGAEERTNDPRPQVASRVSITLSSEAMTVAPQSVGTGPDKNQQLPQNQHESQPPIKTKAPQAVVFVVANQTDEDTVLKISGRSKDVESGPLVASSPGSFQTELPTGVYTLSAGGSSARFAVGPYRASSENDVLLP
jgi:hypothetical protein